MPLPKLITSWAAWQVSPITETPQLSQAELQLALQQLLNNQKALEQKLAALQPAMPQNAPISQGSALSGLGELLGVLRSLKAYDNEVIGGFKAQLEAAAELAGGSSEGAGPEPESVEDAAIKAFLSRITQQPVAVTSLPQQPPAAAGPIIIPEVQTMKLSTKAKFEVVGMLPEFQAFIDKAKSDGKLSAETEKELIAVLKEAAA